MESCHTPSLKKGYIIIIIGHLFVTIHQPFNLPFTFTSISKTQLNFSQSFPPSYQELLWTDAGLLQGVTDLMGRARSTQTPPEHKAPWKGHTRAKLVRFLSIKKLLNFAHPICTHGGTQQ